MSGANTCSSSGGGGGGGSCGGGGGNSGGGGGPCGACKFLRRKCVNGCIFAPYFDSEQGAAHFAAVHKVFGASNVSKLLLHIPVHRRLDAVVTICYEAQARLRDPVYGCVAHIFALQQQVVNLQAELSYLQAHLATLELPSPPPPPALLSVPPPLSISDLPSAATVPATFDLSALFDPLVQPQWTMQQQQQQQQSRQTDNIVRQFGGGSRTQLNNDNPSASGGNGDLQALARELLHRHRSLVVSAPSAEPSAPPPPLSK
ncbi:hypothetical protein BVC80_1827g74 [Macleaya cordata]|uniref:LOB domain-containing protein n=1 Tax=Macleaya cordata TaxID=56857 RepID=A0A200QB71_MACCD|nr:hypothetical protein BVC80_1827g74 [Macleaya cordata]